MTTMRHAGSRPPSGSDMERYALCAARQKGRKFARSVGIRAIDDDTALLYFLLICWVSRTCRLVYAMHYGRGESLAVIANILNIDIETVKSYLSEALAAIKRKKKKMES